jgi:hypothetical protein
MAAAGSLMTVLASNEITEAEPTTLPTSSLACAGAAMPQNAAANNNAAIAVLMAYLHQRRDANDREGRKFPAACMTFL